MDRPVQHLLSENLGSCTHQAWRPLHRIATIGREEDMPYTLRVILAYTNNVFVVYDSIYYHNQHLHSWRTLPNKRAIRNLRAMERTRAQST